MNLRGWMTFALAGMMLLATANTSLAGDGWFGSSKAPAANGVTTTGAKKSWWPSWTKTSKPKPAKSKTSIWGTVTKSTKNTWNKTADFLNPFDNASATTATRSENAANSSSWFSSNKPEKNEPGTLPDFLTLDRPKW